MTVSIIADALKDITEYFEALPEIATKAMVIAVNETARDSEVDFRDEMRKQISFPRNYLRGNRFGVTRKATRGAIEATISARDRPTSLARFAGNATPENSRGKALTLRVKAAGRAVKMVRQDGKPSAFLVRLKNNNVGLAVRLRPGEQLANSTGAVQLANNLYLLYGPSVDQVFQDVADKGTPEVQRIATQKFFRQFARLSGRG